MTDSKITQLTSGKRFFIDISPSPPSPSPPTIIFLHGLGSSTSFYEALLSLSSLSTSHRLVRYDFDGHGLTPVSGEPVSIDSLVEDLKHVIQAVGATSASVVAHSMSGLVAMTFAAKYPELCEKLFLIGPVKALPPATVQTMLTRASTVRTSGLSSLAPSIASSATSSHTKRHVPLSLALIRALVLPTPIEGYARACEALASATDPDWAKIKAETLVVGGEEDYMSSREVVASLVEMIEGARSVEMKDVGHWHAVEQPAALARILDGFFGVEELELPQIK